MDKSGKKKFGADSIVVGFALFSMFFGAGNVIFPPYLGFGAGTQWVNGFLFYFIADIGLALFALFTLLKVGGSENITGRIGSVASNILMSAIILCIGPIVAIPRTAATTFEMSVAPLISGVSPVIFSVAFFIVVLLLSIRQSAVIDVVGKVLTPALLIGLLVLIIKGIISPLGSIVNPHVDSSFVIVNGIKSGYQTMDVLAALAFGIIILKSAQEKGYSDARESSKMIRTAAVIAGVLLLIVYFGLTYLGATSASLFSLDISRAELVIGIVQRLLGKTGLVIFAVVVALACMTTAVALVSSAASFFEKLTKGRLSYAVLVTVICVSSAVISNLGLDRIVAVASPILDIVYPPTLVLIALSWFGDRLSRGVYRWAVIGALIASVLSTLSLYGVSVPIVNTLPLASLGLGWIVPAAGFGIVAYVIGRLREMRKKS
ncbi:MAG: branched-chain amino acid transport system II carrier protein [Oscillospiraceae bacterium]|nr:branched-chain amino acid transport system II carrier protein [Oscillospiraceae bacterium]